MKKSTKTLISLLLVLVMALQFGAAAPAAMALNSESTLSLSPCGSPPKRLRVALSS